MSYLLDTDHCSYLQRRHPHVVERLRSLPDGVDIVASVITQAELLAGVLQSPSERRRAELRGLYEELAARVADFPPVTSRVAEEFAQIITALVRKGTPIPVNDIWIAAIARANGLVVVSSDSHFRWVDGMTVEDWTTPPDAGAA